MSQIGKKNETYNNDKAKYFIEHRTSSWLVIIVLLVDGTDGTSVFLSIGKLEDPASL